MNKKAQGLPLSTIILAALGLVVLVLLFALLTGRLAIFGRGLAECPGSCLTPYVGDTPDLSTTCDATFTRDVPGTYVERGQEGVPIEKIRKCSRCCIAIA